MSPLVVSFALVLLPAVFSADVENIKKTIDVFGKKILDSRAKSQELKGQIDLLGEVYKAVVGNLTEAKGNFSTETQQSLVQFKTSLFTVRSLKEVKSNLHHEIAMLNGELKKLKLAISWVDEDVKVLERRKQVGEEALCESLNLKKKTVQSSRMLGDDEESHILIEELKLSEIQAFDAAEEVKVLQHRLATEHAKLKTEMESTTNLINKYKSNLEELKSKVVDKENEAAVLKSEVDNLEVVKSGLLDNIKTQYVTFQEQTKVLKSFHNAAECYIAVRNSISPNNDN